MPQKQLEMEDAEPIPENLLCDTAQAAMRISGPADKKTTLERWRARGVGPRWYEVASLVGFRRPADIDAYITLWVRPTTSDPVPPIRSPANDPIAPKKIEQTAVDAIRRGRLGTQCTHLRIKRQ